MKMVGLMLKTRHKRVDRSTGYCLCRGRSGPDPDADQGAGDLKTRDNTRREPRKPEQEDSPRPILIPSSSQHSFWQALQKKTIQPGRRVSGFQQPAKEISTLTNSSTPTALDKPLIWEPHSAAPVHSGPAIASHCPAPPGIAALALRG
jgi:hypothetical protein